MKPALCVKMMVIGALSALTFVGAQPVKAANDKHGCTILVNDRGTLRSNVGNTILSSQEVGARAATATVTATNSSYDLTVDAPYGFSSFPSRGSENVEFSSSMSATGATEFFNTPSGHRQDVKRGETDVEVHFSARKLSGSFPAGNYAATVTLRCE